jgi:PPM family protein phosphatase
LTVLRSGSASDVGRVRSVNEDLALASPTLFAVADGMGGHAGGEVAARTAIDALQQEFGRHPSADGLAAAVRQANLAVWERSHEESDLRGMGTTLTAAALVATSQGDRLVMANVGDSRSYRLRDGALTQLSHDHSVAEELVDRGQLSEAEAAIHPHRHILTRALGVSSEVDPDVWEMAPREGDRYLLCSDGLTNEVTETRIAKLLRTTPDPQEAAEKLVQMALDNGGNDNITVVVLDVLVGDEGSTDGAGEAATFPAAVAGQAPTAVEGANGGGGAPTATALKAEAEPAPTSTPSLLGRAGVDPAAGMRAMSARAAEVSQRLRSRRITVRVLLFVVILAAIVAGAFAVVRWYVDSSYYVKIHQGQVVIYQGRMGGFLGIQPKIVQRTGIAANSVPDANFTDVQNGVEESSLRAARSYVCGVWQTEYTEKSGNPPSPKPRFCPSKPTQPSGGG